MYTPYRDPSMVKMQKMGISGSLGPTKEPSSNRENYSRGAEKTEGAKSSGVLLQKSAFRRTKPHLQIPILYLPKKDLKNDRFTNADGENAVGLHTR